MQVMPCFLSTVTEVAMLDKESDMSKRSAAPGCRVSCGYAVSSGTGN